jgi:hypothetical protein
MQLCSPVDSEGRDGDADTSDLADVAGKVRGRVVGLGDTTEMLAATHRQLQRDYCKHSPKEDLVNLDLGRERGQSGLGGKTT